MTVKPFHRKINYYETDKMGITHHSNYVRFMEEARVDFLSQIGWSFDRLESMGYVSPVLSVSCQYKESTVFAEEIVISACIKYVKGVRFGVKYVITKAESGEVAMTGESEHCLLNSSGKPVRLKNELPELYDIFCSLTEE